MSANDLSSELKEIEGTLKKSLEEIGKSYSRYNRMVDAIIQTVDRDYTSVYAVKRAVLETISKHLHDND